MCIRDRDDGERVDAQSKADLKQAQAARLGQQHRQSKGQGRGKPDQKMCIRDRYLVVLWMTKSAPRASGRCSAGEAKVLSTANHAPTLWAATAAAAMSASRNMGLVGVSSHTRRAGPAASAAGTAAGSAVSTKVKLSLIHIFAGADEGIGRAIAHQLQADVHR